jgi:hypothetical protein
MSRRGAMISPTLEFSRNNKPHHDDDPLEIICAMAWDKLDEEDIFHVANAYYYFSIQFRENLEIACRLHPDDTRLASLRLGECGTDNLSPWPKIAAAGEAMDHDEFMRRLLTLQVTRRSNLIETLGMEYLRRMRALNDIVRACSIASYEDGGLSRVFTAMLRAPKWDGEAQQAFRHFLERHILFDDDSENGHGNLSRHLSIDDTLVAPLWSAFAELLALAVPRLTQNSTGQISGQRGGRLRPGWSLDAAT